MGFFLTAEPGRHPSTTAGAARCSRKAPSGRARPVRCADHCSGLEYRPPIAQTISVADVAAHGSRPALMAHSGRRGEPAVENRRWKHRAKLL